MREGFDENRIGCNRGDHFGCPGHAGMGHGLAKYIGNGTRGRERGLVKGFAKQEQAVIKEVTDARAALGGARTPQDKIAANGQLDSALSRLLVVVENYPQLKSNENFLRLQDELAGTENRIAVERRKYNETVQRYNTDIELFPNNIAASMFGFQRNDAYFKTEPGARNAPKVSF
jgi:LemA protein